MHINELFLIFCLISKAVIAVDIIHKDKGFPGSSSTINGLKSSETKHPRITGLTKVYRTSCSEMGSGARSITGSWAH
jgi:hypothetical protein